MPKIRLESNDGKVFDIDQEGISKCSDTIKTMIQDCDEGDELVPLQNVNGRILGKVVEWVEHHKDDARDSISDGRIGEWDEEFIKQMDKYELFALTRAANYLDVKGLLDLTCQAVANLIKGKSCIEIRKLFDLSVAESGDWN